MKIQIFIIIMTIFQLFPYYKNLLTETQKNTEEIDAVSKSVFYYNIYSNQNFVSTIYYLIKITFLNYSNFQFFSNIIIIFLFFILFRKDRNRFKEYITVYILSFVLIFSLINILNKETFRIPLFIYTASLAIYHLMEYFFVCSFHFEKLSYDSILI